MDSVVSLPPQSAARAQLRESLPLPVRFIAAHSFLTHWRRWKHITSAGSVTCTSTGARAAAAAASLLAALYAADANIGDNCRT